MPSVPFAYSSVDFTADSSATRRMGPGAHPAVHRQVLQGAPANAFSNLRRHPVYPVALPSNSVSLSLARLSPDTSTNNHRHMYEALMYVMSGQGYSLVDGQRIDFAAGDALYVPPWCWHQHFANTDVTYITATNMPLLANLGAEQMREEARAEALLAAQHHPGHPSAQQDADAITTNRRA
jgi:quercetin dioxygenase-like cupin family protein